MASQASLQAASQAAPQVVLPPEPTQLLPPPPPDVIAEVRAGRAAELQARVAEKQAEVDTIQLRLTSLHDELHEVERAPTMPNTCAVRRLVHDLWWKTHGRDVPVVLQRAYPPGTTAAQLRGEDYLLAYAIQQSYPRAYVDPTPRRIRAVHEERGADGDRLGYMLEADAASGLDTTRLLSAEHNWLDNLAYILPGTVVGEPIMELRRRGPWREDDITVTLLDATVILVPGTEELRSYPPSPKP
jgi:hypothetical protein